MSTKPAPGRSQGKRQPGFTLVELILFIVIISVGLAGVMAVLNLTTAKSSDPLPVKQSLAVAEGMLEEISLKTFGNPSGGFSGAATQANRALFDDVLDYNGYDQTGVYSAAGATALAGLEGYRVQVTVASVTTVGSAASTPAYVITVTVTDPGGSDYALSAYRTNYD